MTLTDDECGKYLRNFSVVVRYMLNLSISEIHEPLYIIAKFCGSIVLLGFLYAFNAAFVICHLPHNLL